MPAPVLHVGAAILCMHGGTAQPTAPFPRVLVSGQPVVTQATPYVVAACALASVPSPPCVTAQWVLGAMRVLAGGTPLLIATGTAVCVPTGTGLVPTGFQTRVLAS
jgi:hypothetical protein